MTRKSSVVLGRRGTIEERFFVKVRIDERTGCWQWIGSVNAKGYALFGVPGRKSKRAARWIYEQRHGQIAAGLTIDHRCRNTSCVNPDHLEVVTQQENRRRQHAALLQRRAADAA